MAFDFYLLDKNGSQLFNFNIMNNAAQRLNPYTADFSLPQFSYTVEANTTQAGSLAPSDFMRMQSRSVVLTSNGSTIDYLTYNRIMYACESGRALRAVFDTGGVNYDLIAECRIKTGGLNYIDGGLLKGGQFRITIDLLDPLFYSNIPITPLPMPIEGNNFEYSITNNGVYPCPIEIKFQADAPCDDVTMRLAGTPYAITFNDSNFGAAYNILTINTKTGKVESLDEFGNVNDVTRFMNIDTMFYMISSGPQTLQITSTSTVKLLAARAIERFII